MYPPNNPARVFFDFSIKDKTSLLSGCSEFFMAYLFLK